MFKAFEVMFPCCYDVVQGVTTELLEARVSKNQSEHILENHGSGEGGANIVPDR
jgi:hypothetical protein